MKPFTPEKPARSISNTVLLLSLCFTIFTGFAKAQDSIYIYSGNKIVYGTLYNSIDSLTFLPQNYYQNIRSNQIIQFMKEKTEMTRFAQMVEISGLKNYLDRATIWVPTSTSLSQVDLNDTILVTKIVKNHITPGRTSIFELQNTSSVTMLNKKVLKINNSTNSFIIDNFPVTNTLTVANSLICQLNDVIPYKSNLWEFITLGDGHSKYKEYVLQQTTGSTQTNSFLLKYPFISNETQTYTALIPDDNAWDNAYNILYPLATTLLDTTLEAKIQLTKEKIVENLFYKGNHDFKLIDSTYTSTSGYDFKPSNDIQNAVSTNLSNGKSYTISSISEIDTIKWHNPIKIEAEKINNFKTFFNNTTTTITNSDQNYVISNNNFILLTPTVTSDIQSITSYLRIPISCVPPIKYNIYCVFAPATDNITDQKPCKVRFFMSYMNSKGVIKNNYAVNASNEIIASTLTTSAAIFETIPTQVHKMLVVKDFQMPFQSTYYNPTTKVVEPAVFIRINNAAKSSETTYTRNLRIDCIILEPVQ